VKMEAAGFFEHWCSSRKATVSSLKCVCFTVRSARCRVKDMTVARNPSNGQSCLFLMDEDAVTTGNQSTLALRGSLYPVQKK
jgi:hypothetical protein